MPRPDPNHAFNKIWHTLHEIRIKALSRTIGFAIQFSMMTRLLLLSIFLLLGACSDVQFEKSPVSTNAIKTFQPALAVRASGCVMCHANVKSNIVTDFGHGDSYYFGSGSGLSAENGSAYGNHKENWQSANISGKVYIPNASTNGKVAQSTLASYLQNAFSNSPNQSTRDAVIETKSKIYIGAPSASRIRQLANGFPSGQVWKYLGSGSLSGIQSTGSFVKNNGEISCEGDLVIDSVLYLNQANIRTTTGCRMYVTKSVFIDGPITYVGGSPNANLQIVSARAINLGLGTNPCNSPYEWGSANPIGDPVRNRLTEMWTTPGYFTREAGSTASKLNAIYQDHQTIGSPPDAACQSGGRNVEFSALILNAPHVNSRYQGNFKGVIIAEIAIMSLGAFKYEFDSLFLSVPVLPLLQPSEYLEVY